jgi:GAF domain-containing protein/HAMP domain-containing protein
MLNLSNQTFQYLAWIVAIISISLALYILTMNWKHPNHRIVSLFLSILGVFQISEGMLYGAEVISEAFLPSIFIAAISFMILPMASIVTLRLLKPDWLKERWKWVDLFQWMAAALTILPVLIILIDLFSNTIIHKQSNLIYSGLDPKNYHGGYINLLNYTGGMVSPFLRILNFIAPFIVILVLCIFVGGYDKNTSRSIKVLAWILFLVIGFSGILQLTLQLFAPDKVVLIWFVTLLSLLFGYAFFHQMAAEHRLQSGNLRVRMTVLILTIIAPSLLTVTLYITSKVNSQIEQHSEQILEASTQNVYSSAEIWLESQLQTLQQTSLLLEMQRMNVDSLLPAINSLEASNADLELVSVVDLDGEEIARSDQGALMDYSNSGWFKNISSGKFTYYQAIENKPNQSPNLVTAVSIKGENGTPVGMVISFSKLSGLVEVIQNYSTVLSSQLGSSGYIFVVDDQNKTVVHPDSIYTAEQHDLSNYAPIVALRSGGTGLLQFTDDQGITWMAYVNQLKNGWGIVAQQPETEMMNLMRSSQRIPLVTSFLGLLLLAGLIGLTVQRCLFPVQNLSETAFAVSEGNLSIQAPIESEDELGYLAENFNRMTMQLKESISSLEDRVTERTSDLERRSNQLKAAALVSKEAAGIRDIHQLMNQTVQLISNYFEFYHAGLFILDDVREYAVLEAANSEGGQRMLARGHKLRVGQVGIVGYVADVGVPRIALNVGEDAIFFNNPDLPLTRSEMALPLKARGQVIGVLDVQSIEESTFSNEDIETLQVLADQVALALDNARLIKESRDALDELRNLYGQRTRQAWKERLEKGVLSYRYSRTGVTSGSELSSSENSLEMDGLVEQNDSVIRNDQQHEVLVPIILRGQVLGSLVLRRDKDQKPWSKRDTQLVKDLITQVLPALENARLLEEIQNRAQTETLVGQVSSKIQGSLDLETVLKTAVQEIGLVVNASRVQIRMAKAEEAAQEGNG